MKKILFFIILLLLSGCQNLKNVQNHENRFDNNPNIRNDIDMYNDNKELPNCFDLCYNKIQDVCIDEIVDILSEGNVSETSIFNEEACEGMCMSKWSDDTRECMGKITKCDSISQDEPFCKEEENNSIVEENPEKEINKNCLGVCNKYRACAMMADDATTEDGESAYATCFGECQSWSEKTITCMIDTSTGTAMGCSKLSMCGLQEYKSLLKE